MDLKTFIELKSISQKEFADALGIAQSSLSNYLRGTRTVPLNVAVKIEEITKGKVKIKDLCK